MIITNASKIMVKGNLNKKFYWFCVRKNPLLIKYIFINAFYYICSIILNNRNYYLKRKFRFYKNINNLDKTILNFKKLVNLFCSQIVNNI